MDIGYIERLVKIFEKADISELEIINWGSSVKITKRRRDVKTLENKVFNPVQEQMPVPDEEYSELYELKSPEVGFFYFSKDKSWRIYFRKKTGRKGAFVHKGDVLGYIESLGHWSEEITAPFDAIIAKVYVKNGGPVDHGKILFDLLVKKE